MHKPRGFPGCTSGEQPTCEGRRRQRRRFNPWGGNIPWSIAWQRTPVFLPGEYARTEEPAVLQAIGFQILRRNITNSSCMHAHKTRDVIYDTENIKIVGWSMGVKCTTLECLQI